MTARFAAHAPQLDGRPDDAIWGRAEWIELDSSRPARPCSPDEWERFADISGGMGYTREQFDQKVRAAALWNDDGLFLALEAEDADVQALHRSGEWIWIGDVFEVFLAAEARPGARYWEFQVNPANSTFSQPELPLKPRSAVWVDGTVNDSGARDKRWSAEIFLSWDDLEKSGLIATRPDGKTPSPVSAIRFASWDLSIYTQLRLNRFTSPGAANSHNPAVYRPLICLPKP